MGIPPLSYGASLAIWDHTVLPATRHKWTRSAITPVNQAGTRFTYPGRMEGWLGSLIAARPGVEPTTAWLQVWCPNRYTTESADTAFSECEQQEPSFVSLCRPDSFATHNATQMCIVWLKNSATTSQFKQNSHNAYRSKNVSKTDANLTSHRGSDLQF